MGRFIESRRLSPWVLYFVNSHSCINTFSKMILFSLLTGTDPARHWLFFLSRKAYFGARSLRGLASEGTVDHFDVLWRILQVTILDNLRLSRSAWCPGTNCHSCNIIWGLSSIFWNTRFWDLCGSLDVHFLEGSRDILRVDSSSTRTIENLGRNL